ncbi:hypothetical protein [Streptomyces roseoverticillatus]|uniref:hypothetical protein n=1 Tax=Streptomyces roseoverticillatus TaxID=66429 RepID=UPI001FE23AFD|nr:hypothetical protein [Streptomyces roseoverticillatus]
MREDEPARRLEAGEIRGHTQVLNALRETQIEQGKALDAHTKAVEAQSRFQSVAELVGQFVVGQASTADQLDRIENRLGGNDAPGK